MFSIQESIIFAAIMISASDAAVWRYELKALDGVQGVASGDCCDIAVLTMSRSFASTLNHQKKAFSRPEHEKRISWQGTSDLGVQFSQKIIALCPLW